MGDASARVPLGVGAVMMVVIRWIQAVRKGQIREKKSGHSPGGVATGMGAAGFVQAVRDSQNREKIRATYWAVWQWG